MYLQCSTWHNENSWCFDDYLDDCRWFCIWDTLFLPSKIYDTIWCRWFHNRGPPIHYMYVVLPITIIHSPIVLSNKLRDEKQGMPNSIPWGEILPLMTSIDGNALCFLCRESTQSQVDSPHIWTSIHGLMSLLLTWTICGTDSRVASDLRHHASLVTSFGSLALWIWTCVRCASRA